MERKTVAIKINPEIWKRVQHRCIDDEIQFSEFVEEALKSSLEKKKK